MAAVLGGGGEDGGRGCGRGEGNRGRGHASADLAGLRGMKEESGGSAMAEPCVKIVDDYTKDIRSSRDFH
jgi:hypothetical protein